MDEREKAMLAEQVATLQKQVDVLWKAGTVSVLKTSEYGGHFIVTDGSSKVPIGSTFESAFTEIRRMAGIGVKLAPKKLEWGERRGRPSK